MLCSYFCSSGVADGVGGWRSYGVDPSLFPKSLMSACERLIKAGKFTPQKPIEVLSTGYYEVQQDKNPLIGMWCVDVSRALKLGSVHLFVQFESFPVLTVIYQYFFC
jgi:hypothetical protein